MTSGVCVAPFTPRSGAVRATLRGRHGAYDPDARLLREETGDEPTGYVDLPPGTTVHPTRESLSYAVGLLDAGERPERARAILDRVLAAFVYAGTGCRSDGRWRSCPSTVRSATGSTSGPGPRPSPNRGSSGTGSTAGAGTARGSRSRWRPGRTSPSGSRSGRYLRARWLRNGHDYASGVLAASQFEALVVGAASLVTDNGDVHPAIYASGDPSSMPASETLRADRLAVRFEVGGDGPVEATERSPGEVVVTAGGITVGVTVAEALFGARSATAARLSPPRSEPRPGTDG